MNDQGIKREIPAACQGTNCDATDGRSHSPECIQEAAAAQGWSEAPEAVEAMIQAKGAAKGPRITPADIEAEIASEQYFTAADGVTGAGRTVAYEFWHRENGHAIVDYSEQTYVGLLSEEKGYERRPLVHRPTEFSPLDHVTICVLILKNGTKVVGVNEGPVSPENFNADIGREYARQKAVDQIWPMLGYELRSQLARPTLTLADSLADLNGQPRPDFKG